MLATAYLLLMSLSMLIYVIVATALLMTDFKDMYEEIKEIRKEITKLNGHIYD